MKINLIPNWRVAYKYLTVQLSGLLVLLTTAQAFMPELAAYLPTNIYQILGMAILAARFIQQAQVSKSAPSGAVAK